MKKTVIILILALMTILSFGLFACGGGKNDDKPPVDGSVPQKKAQDIDLSKGNQYLIALLDGDFVFAYTKESVFADYKTEGETKITQTSDGIYFEDKAGALFVINGEEDIRGRSFIDFYMMYPDSEEFTLLDNLRDHVFTYELVQKSFYSNRYGALYSTAKYAELFADKPGSFEKTGRAVIAGRECTKYKYTEACTVQFHTQVFYRTFFIDVETGICLREEWRTADKLIYRFTCTGFTTANVTLPEIE